MAYPVLNVAIEAAYIAGELIRRHFRQIDAIPVTQKSRHDYVSEVDRASESEIVREIKRFYPDHAFLCEESGSSGESDYRWVIDPLDGTSNFLHGYPHFSISIAYQAKGRTEHAVVYDPMRDELFTASRGSGAHLNKKRLRVSLRTKLDTTILATAFPFRQREQLNAYGRLFQGVYLKVEDIRRAGSACLDLAWTAAGRVDGFFEIGLKPWDVTAGALLVREAGGVVVDFDGNGEIFDADTLVAAPYQIMTPLLQIIQSKWQPAKVKSGRKPASSK
jgi:myo-inositol-1(or 4)-monophosphatase